MIHRALLATLPFGCSSYDDSRYFEPWRCPGEPMADLEALDANGDGEVTDADLEPGESLVVVRLVEGDGAGRTFQSLNRDATGRSNPNYDDETWGVWHRFACGEDQGASAFVWFPPVDEPTTLDVTAVSLDLFNLEQGDRQDAFTVPLIRITAPTALSLSGYLTGPVEADLTSNLTGEFLGQRIRIESFVFREITL
ncbi:MAG: hypothetical protein AAF602_03360 [Myxococcota bacterium]